MHDTSVYYLILITVSIAVYFRGDFVLEDHVKLFEKYDSWRSDDYGALRQLR